jgi:2-polyprenyl-3-methyl-5-hydroxy-6-metoxy-1,4-benzoquinol methylase
MAAPQADNNDADSALGEDIDHESTTSVLEVPQFTENGRTYYGQEYPLPNDELEKDRLDFQHEIFCITFDGQLFTCPVEKLDRVLDVGTGTGIWSMNFGDAHPEAAVLGIDLSPSQPEWVPPNVRFQLDDLEEDVRKLLLLDTSYH